MLALETPCGGDALRRRDLGGDGPRGRGSKCGPRRAGPTRGLNGSLPVNAGLPNSSLRSPEPSQTQRFEASQVRTFTHVCVHPHPWFEPPLSSNVSITWGGKYHEPHRWRSGRLSVAAVRSSTEAATSGRRDETRSLRRLWSGKKLRGGRSADPGEVLTATVTGKHDGLNQVFP